MKAHRTISNDNQSTNTYSQVHFSGQKSSAESFEAVLVDFSKRSKLSELNVFEDSESAMSQKDSGDTTLVIRWYGETLDNKGEKKTAFGQTKVLLNLQKGDLITNQAPSQDTKFELEYQKLSRKEDPPQPANCQIKYNIKHSPLVRNSFAENPIHLIPIQIFLQNLAQSTAVVTVKAIHGQRY